MVPVWAQAVQLEVHLASLLLLLLLQLKAQVVAEGWIECQCGLEA
jgi:hypothetical protein